MEHVLMAACAGAPPPRVVLTPSQLAAVQRVMRLFVDEDLDTGVSPEHRLHCDACQCDRPMAGFLQFERYQLCNACATKYEVARMCGAVASVGRYVGGKKSGEATISAMPKGLRYRESVRYGAALISPNGKRSTMTTED